MLTDAQETTLAADIRSNTDTDVVNALAIGDTNALAELYALDSALAVWRESISPEEYREVIDWSEVGDLTVDTARIWEWLTEYNTKALDATMPNVRGGLGTVWTATTRTNLLVIAKEFCSIAQSLYLVDDGGGLSDGTTAHPYVRTVMSVSSSDIGYALSNNP